MKIEKMDVNDIIPYINNAKKHPQDQVDQIKASIIAFGFNDPLAIGENNVLIEGHGRLIALKQLGYDQVEVIKLQHLNETQKKQYTLAHNKLTMNSEFDKETLKLELEEIGEGLELTGFDQDEINNLLKKVDVMEEGEEEQEDSGESSTIDERFRVVTKIESQEEAEKLCVELKERGYECDMS